MRDERPHDALTHERRVRVAVFRLLLGAYERRHGHLTPPAPTDPAATPQPQAAEELPAPQ
jgi:hypothetical protein